MGGVYFCPSRKGTKIVSHIERAGRTASSVTRFAFIANDNVIERALLKKPAGSSAGRKQAM